MTVDGGDERVAAEGGPGSGPGSGGSEVSGFEPLAAVGDERSQVHLLGFMASGKSTVAQALARRLVWNFLDLDAVIERHVGSTVAEIFAAHGEAGFREHERFVLRQVVQKPRTVVALGGGTPLSEANRRISAAAAVTVWLRVPFDVLADRVAAAGAAGRRRPLWASDQDAQRLYEERAEAYALADLAVAADDEAATVAARVEARLRRLPDA